MEYLIIKSRILDEVTILVNRHLAEGWEIVGGVACNNYFYCQAMIKPEVISDPLNNFNVSWETPPGLETLADTVDLAHTYAKPKRSHKKKT